jgi:hypothetical protein
MPLTPAISQQDFFSVVSAPLSLEKQPLAKPSQDDAEPRHRTEE